MTGPARQGASGPAVIDTGAEFSTCGQYRYRLWRRWADGPDLMVVGLNPSTADATVNDPTVRRCLGYAQRWGFAGLWMMNLYAYRATDPRVMQRVNDPVGPLNRWHLNVVADLVMSEGGAILAAWGGNANGLQSGWFRRHAADSWGYGVACLGLTKAGEPKHPLYLRSDATPIPFLGDGGRLCQDTSR